MGMSTAKDWVVVQAVQVEVAGGGHGYSSDWKLLAASKLVAVLQIPVACLDGRRVGVSCLWPLLYSLLVVGVGVASLCTH